MSTVLKPITALSELAVGDTIVGGLGGNSRKLTVTAVGKTRVLVEVPSRSGRTEEVSKPDSTITSTYKVERPEELPEGFDRRNDSAFSFRDWAGDSGRIGLDVGYHSSGLVGRAAITLDSGVASLHLDSGQLRFLADQADAYAASRR